MSVSLWSDEQERPVQHLRVIDMTIMVPGPYLTRLLTQYGADVLKVEALPTGDPLRRLNNTALFELLNQGKRGLAVNLRTEKGQEIVKQLAAEADVFVENFREGVMDQFGLSYATLSEQNPDLLYFSLRGLSGKNANRAAHDFNFVALSGCGEWFLSSATPNYSTHFADIIGGTLVPMIKLLFHLANPVRRGMHLVCSMDESFRALYLPRAFDCLKSEQLPVEQREAFGSFRSLDGSYPHSRYYLCRDGQWITLNAIQEKHWNSFCEVVDRPLWKPRMWDKTLVSDLEKLFQDAPASYWEALSGTRDLCLFRVVPWKDHLLNTQARAQLSSDPLTWPGFSACSGIHDAPKLGEDTLSTLHSIGLDTKEITLLAENGVIAETEKTDLSAKLELK